MSGMGAQWCVAPANRVTPGSGPHCMQIILLQFIPLVIKCVWRQC